MIDKTTHIVFICQPGQLEVKALLLAYSLEQNWEGTKEVLVPEHLYREINPATIKLFNRLNTSIRTFKNTFIQNRELIKSGDWMSNKFFALRVVTNNKNILFLDSDIIQLGKIPSLLEFLDLAAKPADMYPRVNWEKLLKLTDLTYPKRQTTTTIDEVSGPPYFNSGVLFIKANKSQQLIEVWEKYFILLSQKHVLLLNTFDSFHRDQIALTLAIEELKICYTELDESMNFPIRRRGSIETDIVFAHYHDSATLFRTQELLAVFNNCLKEYPEFLTCLKPLKDWRLLANNRYSSFLRYQKYNSFKRKILKHLKRSL